ncbi:MAG: sigma 54-interacting transcriptional regulator [Myxococcales bacterium]|jgi:formate hydrogenlyase transcriptional activator
MSASCRPQHSREESEAIIDKAISAVLATVDLQAVLERTARLLRGHFGETRVAILRLLEKPAGEVEVLFVDDPRFPGPEAGSRFPLAGSACGEAIRTKRPLVVDPIDPKAPGHREEAFVAPHGYSSLVTFPLLFEGEPLGALQVAHFPEAGLLSCCLRTAEKISRLLAIALHNSLMVEEVKRLNRLLDRENARLREELREVRRESRYVAESPAMREVIERVRLVAALETTVLVRGETGTGKEGLARMVHDFSPRFGGPFVAVNMGAIPETLIESELFGHEKGAFTGATRRKAGRFEQAEGGTIFLDEIGDAPQSVQARLLRVLQEREVQRVGGDEPIKVDVRVVAATNRPLEKMVEQGTFRADLYYRLNTFPIELPPLRERVEDIRPLVTWFLARHAASMHRKPPEVSEASWRVLESMEWPGNVRELENYVQRALILSPEAELVLPETERSAARPRAAARAACPRSFEVEVREVITRALDAAEGRIYGPNGAAALLGLKPTTLQGKMRKYGIRRG